MTFAWNKVIQEMNKPFTDEWAQDKVATKDSDATVEAFFDQQTQEDMQAIAHMLEASEKEGLQCEVVYQLIQIMCNTTNIPRACAAALSEWDI